MVGEEVKNTRYNDANGRKIKVVKRKNKRVFFVRKRRPDGTFEKVVRKAKYINGGRMIRTTKSVPKAIRPKMNNRLNMREMTMNGLNHWHRHLFEHFGWMILAGAKGYGYKIPTYKRSIQEFIKTAEKLHNDYQNANRRHDVKILLKNVKVLGKFAKML
jgi:hypothetical protein